MSASSSNDECSALALTLEIFENIVILDYTGLAKPIFGIFSDFTSIGQFSARILS